MIESHAASSPDRLPWLADERRSRPISAAAIILSCVVWIAVLVAGVSYSPWALKFGTTNRSAEMAAAAREEPDATPREALPEVYGNLELAPPPAPVTLPAEVPPIAPPPLPAPIARAPAAPAQAIAAPPAAAAAAEAPAPAAATSPPTDCRLAKTRAALAVCSNQRLAALDREHALLYNQSWRYADPAKRALLTGARQRLTSNLNACATDACSSGIYLAAMREVSGIMSARIAPARATPSFSCRVAKRRGEIAVCADASLAALDRQQALLYSQSWGRADTSKRAKLLRAHQRLVSRRDRCGSQPCTKRVYLAAMKEVAAIMSKE